MVRAGQSSEKSALIYQHSDEERQRDVAAGLDDMVRAERAKHHKADHAHHDQQPTGSTVFPVVPHTIWHASGTTSSSRTLGWEVVGT
jgi:hypothetical protein